ncbi:MAG: FGGY family carbohydrate kinase [Lachnospiraceae bacterium]|nr:FGGY family carbohydrate kinase [Lachnospiraceae bacterium]
MSKILVLNMGMKSIRSIIFDNEGNKLASASVPISTALEEECVTQDPNEWWEKGKQVISQSIEELGTNVIDYITVTTSSACLVCVDAKINALLPCMMVSDKRARKESEQIKSAKAFKKIWENTGLDMDSYLMTPKALWVKNNHPDLYTDIYKFLAPNDFLIAKLSDGICVTDYMNAQKWHYDMTENCYPDTLLREIGLDMDKLPEVLSLGTYVSNVSQKASTETGLSTDTKIIVSTYDAICSFVGSGVTKEGEACDISGTVTVFRTVASGLSNKKLKGIQQIPYKEQNLCILGGSNNMGGSLIEWVKQCYYQNEDLPYELMEKDAREAGEGAGGLIFLPYLLGERAPIWDSDARGVFFGLERSHTRKEMTRAVFESTGFIDLDMIHAIEKNGGRVDKIRLSGGLARVGLISQMKADITGKYIEVLDEFETTASGAAVIALLGQKELQDLDDAAEKFANVRMIIKPNRKKHEKYLKLYQLYKETYETIKPLFPKRKEIVSQVLGDKKIKIENL